MTDLPPIDDSRAATITWDVTPRRGFLRELAGGERLIAEIGDLPVVSLDLATAKPDVVEFKAACDRMYANLTLPPQRWAKLLFEDLDPFTDRGQIFLALFHETSHEGGNQVRFGVNCANDEHAHGVNLVVELPRPLRPPALPDAATSQLRLRLNAESVIETSVSSSEGWPDRWTTFDLSPGDDRVTTEFPALLAEAQTMTIHWFDVPALRFDLAAGRPAISDFASKCEAMLRRPSIVGAGGVSSRSASAARNRVSACRFCSSVPASFRAAACSASSLAFCAAATCSPRSANSASGPRRAAMIDLDRTLDADDVGLDGGRDAVFGRGRGRRPLSNSCLQRTLWL